MKQKKLPIGLSTFKTIIEENYYYVDKSLLIKELIDSGASVTILPRPRRFGKTLNLNMLKCFFEHRKNQDENLFKDLAIWQAGADYRKHYGKYPVIYLTLKDIKLNDWQRCFMQIKRTIKELFMEFPELPDSPRLTEGEKKEYAGILNDSATESSYLNSLKFLSSLLHKHYKERVVILIDEYDIPIQQGYTHNFYPEVVEFSKTFLSGGLKDNPCLEKAVLTGILRVAKESIFSDLNNPDVCTLLNRKYAERFGLLENEVVELLNYFGIGFEMDHVRDWYNGYLCGETELYNPWSIICYADKWQEGLKPYWVHTSANTLIKEILSRAGEKIKLDMKELIEDKTITRVVNENIVFPEIESNENYLFSFLLFSGYLKPIKTFQRDRKTFCELAIPNEEVKYLYENIIASWFSETIENHTMELMLKSLVTGDINLFSRIFADYVEASVSYFHLGDNDAERVYQAFTLGLVIWLNKDYVITSEEPAGYGRADLMLIPHDKNKKGIIFEFKKADKRTQQTLEQAASEAKQQIIDKHYRKKMEAHGVLDVICLAAAFKGKEVLIVKVS
ncbi:MAG: AAA family ATPase [Spirochaetales bacterium]|nr:AAA family ATPase [Spirochaetales bacterium]